MVRGKGPSRRAGRSAVKRTVCALLALAAVPWMSGIAGPLVDPGDLALRNDLQTLADAGVLSGPVTAWPVSWGSLYPEISAFEEVEGFGEAEQAALDRVLARMRYETRPNEVALETYMGGAKAPPYVRDFRNRPRGQLEGGTRVEWTGQRFAGRINLAGVRRDPADPGRVRLDGSYIAAKLNNWIVSYGALERWWGPGWDNSPILSTAARPIPALTVQRNFSDPVRAKALRWLGPWTATAVFGHLESERAIRSPRFFGFQLNFRPRPKIEVGFQRTAIWCGEGRGCGSAAVGNPLAGPDTSGQADAVGRKALGNQLAGGSVRILSPFGDKPYAIYVHLVGEDTMVGLPTKLFGLAGVESRVRWRDRNVLLYAEATDTACNAFGRPQFDCAYTDAVYATGYRYRGRSLGSSFEQDSRGVSLGGILTGDLGHEWGGTVRYAKLNRGGAPTGSDVLAPAARNLAGLEVFHRRWLKWGNLEFGVGVDWGGAHGARGGRTETRAYARYRRYIELEK